MDVYRGIPVYPGVVIGPALPLDTDGFLIPKRSVDPGLVENEIQRLKNALSKAAISVRKNQAEVSSKVGSQFAAILGAHAQMIEDPFLSNEIVTKISSNNFTAEYAVSQVLRQHIKEMEALPKGAMVSRTADLFDIEKQILGQLIEQKQQELGNLTSPVVILAHDLSPNETAKLNKQFVHAFATEAGGRTSHTSILAGAMEIPAVVGLGKFLQEITGGDIVIVDGDAGLLIVNPDEEILENYRKRQSQTISHDSSLEQLKSLPAITKDGVQVRLMGNIEFPHETVHCLEKGAEGIGLYRTEFLFMGKETIPSEEEQYQAYKKVLEDMGRDRPVVIRTLDLGGDKLATGTQSNERNPFLGLRSIRLCLRNIGLFKTQIRAILRASVHGNVHLLFPMISTVLELRQAKMILSEIKEDLQEENVPFQRDIPIGTMIEVPSAAILADCMAKEVSFFSIGTNDLVQYTLAADRSNEDVASLYNPGDPAVIKLIDLVAKAAGNANLAVSVCGEMSGDPIYTMLLLGLGIRQFSVAPHSIPEIKQIIRMITLPEAENVAREAMRLETARDVNNYLRGQIRKLIPDPMV